MTHVADMDLIPAPKAVDPADVDALSRRVLADFPNGEELLEILGLDDPRDVALEALWPVADRLARLLDAQDGEGVATLLEPLTAEDRTSLLLVVTDWLNEASGRCGKCSHLDVFHSLSGKGERTGCSWHEGSDNRACRCKRFEEAS